MRSLGHGFCSWAALVLLLMILIPVAPSQSVPYRTSFESPTFTTGPLGVAGQDGWTNRFDTAGGYIQSTTPLGIRTGSQSLMIEPLSSVGRTFSAPGAQRVYIDGFYVGPTVNTLPDPTTILEQGSSLILFHATQGIMGLDGNGTGGGTWVSSGVQVASNKLQRITVIQNYTTQKWDLYVDKTLKLSNLGFKNQITQLNGVSIETSEGGKGFLDDFSVTTVPPEFLMGSALFDFQREWQKTEQETDLNWDLAPSSADGKTNVKDLLELMNRMMQ